MGVRPLVRLIDNKIKSSLSREVLFSKLVDSGKVTVTIVDGNPSFDITELPKPLTKAERKALKAAALAEAKKDEPIRENQDDQ